jgi:hypothetical protein
MIVLTRTSKTYRQGYGLWLATSRLPARTGALDYRGTKKNPFLKAATKQRAACCSCLQNAQNSGNAVTICSYE